jgi:hypothetical protein
MHEKTFWYNAALKPVTTDNVWLRYCSLQIGSPNTGSVSIVRNPLLSVYTAEYLYLKGNELTLTSTHTSHTLHGRTQYILGWFRRGMGLGGGIL